jgi:hypothetical protein
MGHGSMESISLEVLDNVRGPLIIGICLTFSTQADELPATTPPSFAFKGIALDILDGVFLMEGPWYVDDRKCTFPLPRLIEQNRCPLLDLFFHLKSNILNPTSVRTVHFATESVSSSEIVNAAKV